MKNNQKQWFEKLPTVYYTECGTQATSDDGMTWNYRNQNLTEEEWIKLVYESEYKLNPGKEEWRRQNAVIKKNFSL